MTVSVGTSRRLFAETEGTVYLTLFGDRGVSETMKLQQVGTPILIVVDHDYSGFSLPPPPLPSPPCALLHPGLRKRRTRQHRAQARRRPGPDHQGPAADRLGTMGLSRVVYANTSNRSAHTPQRTLASTLLLSLQTDGWLLSSLEVKIGSGDQCGTCVD